MRLSEINPQNLQDEDIQTIVYSDISDNGRATKEGKIADLDIVFDKKRVYK